MTTYRLASSGMVHTPGIIAWAINGYAFETDRQQLLETICATYPALPTDAVHKLLIKAVPFTVEAETVVFSVEAGK